MRKKLLALFTLTISLLLLAFPVNAKTSQFKDVNKDHPFYEYINNISEQEIINGYSDGNYWPDKSVTRGQFAKILVNAFNISEDLKCDPFKDVTKEHPFYTYITTLKCHSLVTGHKDGTYGSEENITRAQAVKLFFIIGKLIDWDNFPLFRTIQLYKDVDVDNEMYFFIDSLASIKLKDNSRIINGYSNGNFGPDDPISRGQIAKLIIKMQKYVDDGGEFQPPLSNYINDFSDKVIDGTVTEDNEYDVKEEYDLRHTSDKSVLVKPAESNSEFEKHNMIWKSFADIIPFTLTKYIDKMILIDNHDAISAGVTRNFGGNVANFIFIVNQKELQDNKVAIASSVHESAHILSLSSKQLTINKEIYDTFSQEEFDKRLETAMAECHTYFVLGGCAKSDSYIYNFYNQFWADKIEEYDKVRESESQEVRNKFYLKYNDQFVSNYSMFDPAEDFAESFSYFVYFEKPKDSKSVVNQKLNFFYKYPEIVKIKKEIQKKLEK